MNKGRFFLETTDRTYLWKTSIVSVFVDFQYQDKFELIFVVSSAWKFKGKCLLVLLNTFSSPVFFSVNGSIICSGLHF